MTDIEIAQAHEMKPITEIAAAAGIDEQHLELYGKYKAKVDYSILKEETHRRPGRRAQQDRQEDHGLPA